MQNENDTNRSGPEGCAAATLFGIPVDLFIWDGTKEHAAAVLQRKHQDHVMLANGGVPILNFRGERGNAHIVKGGWILRFGGKIFAHGHSLPNADGDARRKTHPNQLDG